MTRVFVLLLLASAVTATTVQARPHHHMSVAACEAKYATNSLGDDAPPEAPKPPKLVDRRNYVEPPGADIARAKWPEWRDPLLMSYDMTDEINRQSYEHAYSEKMKTFNPHATRDYLAAAKKNHYCHGVRNGIGEPLNPTVTLRPGETVTVDIQQ